MSATAEARTSQRKEFRVDVPFTKAATQAESGDLEIVGYANTWVQDRDGDYVDPGAFDKSLPAYLSKNPILLYQHNHDWGLGWVTEATTDDTGLRIKAVIPKPVTGEEAWKFTAFENARRGVYRTMSIGGFFSFDVESVGEEDEKWIIREVELFEISVVSVPSNPDSIFEAATKSAKGQRSARELSSKAFNQMIQLLGVEDVSDPELVPLEEGAREDRYNGLATIFAEVKGRPAPTYHAYRDVAGALDDADLVAKMAALPQVTKLIDELYAAPAEVSAPKKGAPAISQADKDRIGRARDELSAVLEQVQPDH